MADITSSNSVLSLGATGLYPTPQVQRGFAADDAYSMASIEVSENQIGVDGIKSSGFIPTLKELEVTLQADSPSIDFWEGIFNAQEAGNSQIQLFGNLVQPSIGKAYDLSNGTLKGYTPFAGAKKVLQPRKFSVVFQVVAGAPLGF